jgi:hypothetical protein
MDTLSDVLKQKRAETLALALANGEIDDPEDTIVVEDLRFGLPSNEEDDPNASDVDQSDSEPLQNSTLFWDTQLIISRQDDDEMGLGKRPLKHQMKGTPALLRKIFIILNYY